MKRSFVFSISVLLFLVDVLFPVLGSSAAEPKTPAPQNRIVAMYFHRTERCPTCLKMGSYTEEAIKLGFPAALKKRAVELHFIDFQNEKNAAFTKAYKIQGPSLIVARVADGKVAEYKDLKDIWTHVDHKDKFLQYVRDTIVAYQKKNDGK